MDVDHFPSLGAPTDSPQLDGAVRPGDTHIQVSGNGTINAGTLIRLGATADGDEEYVIAASDILRLLPSRHYAANARRAGPPGRSHA